MPETIAVWSDGRVAAWSELDPLSRAEDSDVAGGVLTGDAGLVAEARRLLSPDCAESSVLVLSPNARYTFTARRDSPPDVAAALLAAGGPRAHLSYAGWDRLADALSGDDAEPSHDSPTIY